MRCALARSKPVKLTISANYSAAGSTLADKEVSGYQRDDKKHVLLPGIVAVFVCAGGFKELYMQHGRHIYL